MKTAATMRLHAIGIAKDCEVKKRWCLCCGYPGAIFFRDGEVFGLVGSIDEGCLVCSPFWKRELCHALP